MSRLDSSSDESGQDTAALITNVFRASKLPRPGLNQHPNKKTSANMRPLRTAWFVMIFLLTFPMGQSYGQEDSVEPDLGKIAGGKGWTVYNATADIVEIEGKSAVRLKARGDSASGIAGLALVNDAKFGTGVIEVDLKGRDVRPSFVGVAFNAKDEKTFEAIYFRPFNFNADGVFKGRAVQYISWPEYTWEKLRKERPGKFEAPVSSVPDANKWFHARIEVRQKQVLVYVNEAKEPCLSVDRLVEGVKGRPAGLFVDTGDGLYAHFKVIPVN
jgi:hypothetical protein